MIQGRYIAHIIREHRVLILFAFFFVGLFQVLIIALVVGADLLGMIEQFFRQMPPQVQFLIGEQFLAQFSINGAVAFGYTHPLVIVMMSLVAILLPTRHIAGEIEAGTLELLFALPVRRPTIVLSLWVASALVLLGLVMGCWAGSGVGLLVYPETRTIPLHKLLQIGVNLWLLTMAISSYTLLMASYVREGSKATLRASGLTLIFYFLNIAVLMWPTIHFLQPLSLFHYHYPQRLMQDGSLLIKNGAVLGVVIVVCTVLAVRQVSRRDIPG